MHAMTFEIIHFFFSFCGLAEQNIWPYFLTYKQIINNSRLILPKLLPLLPSPPSLRSLIELWLFFSHLISYSTVVNMIYCHGRCRAPVIYAAVRQLVHCRGLRPLQQTKGGPLDSHGYAYRVTLWDKRCCTGSHPPLTMLYE